MQMESLHKTFLFKSAKKVVFTCMTVPKKPFTSIFSSISCCYQEKYIIFENLIDLAITVYKVQANKQTVRSFSKRFSSEPPENLLLLT